MDTEVVIIGAGIAGLAAAERLLQAGRQVQVLEARARVGGRIFTSFPPRAGRAIELGAEFVHGGNALLEAAFRRAGMRAEPVDHSYWTPRAGVFHPDPGYWRAIGKVADRLPPKSAVSVASALATLPRLDPADRERVAAYVEGFDAAPVERMSATAFHADRGGVDAPQLRPAGGYGPVVTALATRLREGGVTLRLRTPATAVRWSPGRVEVQTHRGRPIAARLALITLPLGVWQAGRVRFDPPLRAKDEVVRRLGWGQVHRVTLQFGAGFWSGGLPPRELVLHGRPRFGFMGAAGAEIPTWWAPDPTQPLLVGWVGGPRAAAWLALTPARSRDRALHALAELWQCPAADLRRQLRGSWTRNWTADPWSQGAYSHAVAGFDDGPARLAQPVADTLFFAGEATAEELGTVHGALASGVRAAGEALAALRG